jgi:hypothetical protein
VGEDHTRPPLRRRCDQAVGRDAIVWLDETDALPAEGEIHSALQLSRHR